MQTDDRCKANKLRSAIAKPRVDTSEPTRVSPNDEPVALTPPELAPYVNVIKPARPALTYDRIE